MRGDCGGNRGEFGGIGVSIGVGVADERERDRGGGVNRDYGGGGGVGVRFDSRYEANGGGNVETVQGRSARIPRSDEFDKRRDGECGGFGG